jgi:hypothetical protein
MGSTAARVALHWSAHNRGYKLSREGTDPKSLLRGDVCVVVLVRCVFFLFSSVAPASPFIVSKGRARVIFVVKRYNGEKMKEKNKKGGLRCDRLPPYLVGIVSL